MPETPISSVALALCAAVLLGAGIAAARPPAAGGASESWLECGEPLVKAGLESRGLPFTGLTSSSGPAVMLMADSAKRVKEMRASLGDLSPEEKKIAGLVLKFPVPLVHRTSLDRLRSILSSGALLSPREASRRGIDLTAYVYGERPGHAKYSKIKDAFSPSDMAGWRNQLEGGLDCVFASAGNPAGKDAYGEIILEIDPERVTDRMLAGVIGAPTFLRKKKDRASGSPVGQEEILSYSGTVYSGSLSRELLSLLIISGLREGGRAAVFREGLLKATDPDSFYALVTEGHLAYFEAKIPKEVPLSDVEAVLVPGKNLQEVLSWEEAKPWLAKIKAY